MAKKKAAVKAAPKKEGSQLNYVYLLKTSDDEFLTFPNVKQLTDYGKANFNDKYFTFPVNSTVTRHFKKANLMVFMYNQDEYFSIRKVVSYC